LEDIGVNGRIILKLIVKKEAEGADCVNLAQDRVSGRAFVKTVMNLRVHKMRIS
jgi:hypothetical protein